MQETKFVHLEHCMPLECYVGSETINFTKSLKLVIPFVFNQCIIFKTVMVIKFPILSLTVEILSVFHPTKSILQLQLKLSLLVISIVQLLEFHILHFVFKVSNKFILFFMQTLDIVGRSSLWYTMFEMPLSSFVVIAIIMQYNVVLSCQMMMVTVLRFRRLLVVVLSLSNIVANIYISCTTYFPKNLEHTCNKYKILLLLLIRMSISRHHKNHS